MATDTLFVIEETTRSIADRYVDLGIIAEMSLADRMNAPGPTQVSNRNIYERCIAWGCKPTRSNGNWVWMQTLFGPRFKVRPVQQHEANGREVIETMLESLYLPWAYFIAAEITDLAQLQQTAKGFIEKEGADTQLPSVEMGPCSVCNESVHRAVLVKSGKKIAHKYCVKKPAAEPDNTPQEKEPEPVLQDVLEVIVSELPEEEPPQVRQRYINKVFDLLVERGDAMSNQAVADAVGISRAQATSALSNLCEQGVLERVKAGVYRAKPQVTNRTSMMGVVVSGDGQQIELTAQERPVTRIITAAAASQVKEPDLEEDETLNELIDLIAPNGFRARHLPLIDSFKRSALALMREVNGDV